MPNAVAAVRRLNAYRFLCGLPANVTLDPEQTPLCSSRREAAQSRRQTRPYARQSGRARAEYKDGYNGTSHSNIFTATPISSLAKSVDAYMDDSDAGNICRLGHRRWCLNPAMQTTGFGKYQNFSAMWSFDSRRPNLGDWDIVAYPARGYMPTEYFSPDRAWSLIVNRSRHRSSPPATSTSRSAALDDALHPGSPLELDYKAVETGGYGGGPAMIFRPKSLDMAAGRRYGVEIKGVSTDQRRQTDDDPLHRRIRRSGRAGTASGGEEIMFTAQTASGGSHRPVRQRRSAL